MTKDGLTREDVYKIILKKNICFCFCLCQESIAVCGLSLAVESRVHSLMVCGLLLVVASLVAEQVSRMHAQ